MQVAASHSHRPESLRAGEFLFLGALLFITEEGGYFSTEFDRLVTLGLLIWFVVAFLRSGRLIGPARAVPAFVACHLVLVPGDDLARCVPLIVLLSLALFHRTDVVLRRLCFTATLYVTLIFCLELVPAYAAYHQTLAHGLSVLVGSMTGSDVVLGPTAVGLPVVYLLAAYVLAIIVTNGTYSRRRTIAALLLIWVAPFTFHLLAESTSSVLDRVSTNDRTLRILYMQRSILIGFDNFFRFRMPIVHLLLGFIIIDVVLFRRVYTGIELTRSLRWVWPLTLTFATAMVVSVGFRSVGDSGDRIHFHDKGRFDWDLPTFKAYGGQNVGMFGLLPRLLTRLGYDVSIGDISSDRLSQVDVLVTINGRDAFTSDAIESVRNFVRSGGSLLILGDHTRHETNDPYNELLGDTGIQFNFDTVQPMEMGWPYSLRKMPCSYPRPPRSAHEINHWVGASLAVSGPARPLLVGKYCFSDYGNEADIEMNKLGNRFLNAGEQLGDLVLVAEQNYGKGKVVVYGDTTTYQNRQLVQTWRHVRDVFAYACGPSQQRLPGWLAALLWTGSLSLYVLVARRSNLLALAAPLIVINILLPMGQARVDRTYPMRDFVEVKGEWPLAVIDLSHNERLVLDASKAEALDGLTYNLMRNGFIPIVAERDLTSFTSNASLVILSAPARPLAPETVENIQRFVTRGGTLMVCSGWEESATVAQLLSRFSCSIDGIPLGKVYSRVQTGIVGLHEAWPVRCTKSDKTELLSVLGEPVAVFCKEGKGSVVVVGDTHFLQAHNLEESGRSTANGGFQYYVSMPNVDFLKDVLSARSTQ